MTDFSEEDRERVELSIGHYAELLSWQAVARLLASHDSLQAEVERLREALAFYADTGNYAAQNPRGSGAPVWNDVGERARAALNPEGTEGPSQVGLKGVRPTFEAETRAEGTERVCPKCGSDDPKVCLDTRERPPKPGPSQPPDRGVPPVPTADGGWRPACPDPFHENTLLNVRETAQALSVHENTVRNWEKQGTLKAVRLPGSGIRRFRREDVDRMRQEMLSQFAPDTTLPPRRRLLNPEGTEG